MVDETLLRRITADPEIFGGKPIIRGLRISVELILSLLAQGETPESILTDYPDLDRDDLRACLAMEAPDSVGSYVVCIDNGGYPESLEVCKLYFVLPDERAAANHYLRVIDETGEDYLYPAKHFVPIQLPPEVAKILPVGSGLRNGRPR